LIEFGWLGFIAGILGAAMSEAAVAIIQIKQFDLPFSMHWPLWYTLPFISAALVTLFGWWTSRQVVQVPPNQLLRDAG
jgi:putative ABC transport system permease protein